MKLMTVLIPAVVLFLMILLVNTVEGVAVNEDDNDYSKECYAGGYVTYNITVAHTEPDRDPYPRVDVLLKIQPNDGNSELSIQAEFTLDYYGDQQKFVIMVTPPKEFVGSVYGTDLSVEAKNADDPTAEYRTSTTKGFVTTVKEPIVPPPPDDDTSGTSILIYIIPAVGGIAIVAIWLLDRKELIGAGALSPFYTRFNRTSVMEKETRQEIFTLLDSNGKPLTPLQIAEQLDLPRTTVNHHLYMLKKHRKIYHNANGSYTTRYNPEMNMSTSERIGEMYYLEELSQVEIARRLNLTRQTVNYHVRRQSSNFVSVVEAS